MSLLAMVLGDLCPLAWNSQPPETRMACTLCSFQTPAPFDAFAGVSTTALSFSISFIAFYLLKSV